MIDYPLDGNATPGMFDHKSGDCEIHGFNISTFRPKTMLGHFTCVQCALIALSRQYDDELNKHTD